MKKPILCLAPLADVTDVAFRHIIAKYSKEMSKGAFEMPRSQKAPFDISTYVTYTEFVSADGLVLAPETGRRRLLKDLEYSEIERPIVAQLFSSNPENMKKVASLVMELGFDGVDINMGCPDKSVEKQGAGAALIKNPKLAREIIRYAKTGIKEAAERLGKEEIPLSVKTRLGYNDDELESWLPELLAENPAAIIIHARTRKEMSKVPARWERIRRAVEIRDEVSRFNLDTQKTLIIGNGDVLDVADAIKKCEESGADGAMLGRAVFGNPWLFSTHVPTASEKLKVLLEHIKLFEEKLGGVKNFAVMKKHFKAYLSGFPVGSDFRLKELRDRLMQTKDAKDAEILLSEYL
ncbi:MAG: tRNA-dihydrouridine synthase [Parcubacteria group bacterium GW2011_GWA1_38_7]|nr:MAG: tRNA-dihydrouridine synthase [Parcubacteria group bacterium GW2011_GWA1_38_7]